MRFSAIARSVMIFAPAASRKSCVGARFSAIARSIMIFAQYPELPQSAMLSFSAIARSVMIFAFWGLCACTSPKLFQCYSS